MESIREIYKIGNGPSSSHTMAPAKAASIFKERNPAAAAYHVTLYGSLAATGKGHLTDKAIIESFSPVPVEISWKATESIPPHPNGMKFQALNAAGSILHEWTTFSIGGGDISDNGLRESKNKVYEMSTLKDRRRWSSTNHPMELRYRKWMGWTDESPGNRCGLNLRGLPSEGRLG